MPKLVTAGTVVGWSTRTHRLIPSEWYSGYIGCITCGRWGLVGGLVVYIGTTGVTVIQRSRCGVTHTHTCAPRFALEVKGSAPIWPTFNCVSQYVSITFTISSVAIIMSPINQDYLSPNVFLFFKLILLWKVLPYFSSDSDFSFEVKYFRNRWKNSYSKHFSVFFYVYIIYICFISDPAFVSCVTKCGGTIKCQSNRSLMTGGWFWGRVLHQLPADTCTPSHNHWTILIKY